MTSFIKLHKKTFICLILILVLVGAAAVGIPRLMASDSAAEGRAEPNAIRLSKMDLANSISATGTLESSKSSTITAAGTSNIVVKKVLAAAGDSVKKGDPLITFDENDLRDALAEAKENLEDTRNEAKRSADSANSKVLEAEETFEADKAKLAKKVSEAKKEKTKAKKLVTQLQAKSDTARDANEEAKWSEQLTKAKEAMQQADTAYENAVENQSTCNKQNQSSINNAKEALETTQRSGEKSIKDAKRQVEEAANNLKACSVTAPMDGTVTSVSVEEGSIYTGGTIMAIEDLTSFVAVSSVDEYDIGKVKAGQKVVILTEATGEEELDGTITFVAPTMASSQSQQTGSSSVGDTSSDSSGYEIKIQVNSKNDALKPGMTAKCSIILEETKNVFAVPYDAVHTNKDGTKVIYVQNGNLNNDWDETKEDNKKISTDHLELAVTTGMETDYYVEISSEDLEEGMRVLIPTDETVPSTEEKDEKDTSFSFGGGMHGGMGGNLPERNGNPPQNMGNVKGNN